jgi:predicted nucleic acid-binding protein
VSYLLDANVLSEWRKPAPNPGVVEWFGDTAANELYLSVVTVGEIRRGIAKLQLRNDHRQATVYESWLATTKRQFADRLATITAEVAEEWGHSTARYSVPTADGLIAATAKVHGWTLVTRNVKDFQPTGVRLLNPFTD